MRFTETPLPGAYLVDLEKREDDRGFFARAFCVEEFGRLGLETGIVQINNSLSARKGTLRGMHYQLPPMAETKIVRCLRGSFFDAIIDLRPGSPSFKRWFGETLSADNRRALYVPKGFAHGILTLEDEHILKVIAASAGEPAVKIADALLGDVEAANEPHQDNTTVVVVKIMPAGLTGPMT